nr:hypothetical protein Iba_chr02bCG6190 [Ipomoea batatas]
MGWCGDFASSATYLRFAAFSIPSRYVAELTSTRSFQQYRSHSIKPSSLAKFLEYLCRLWARPGVLNGAHGLLFHNTLLHLHISPRTPFLPKNDFQIDLSGASPPKEIDTAGTFIFLIVVQAWLGGSWAITSTFVGKVRLWFAALLFFTEFSTAALVRARLGDKESYCAGFGLLLLGGELQVENLTLKGIYGRFSSSFGLIGYGVQDVKSVNGTEMEKKNWDQVGAVSLEIVFFLGKLRSNQTTERRLPTSPSSLRVLLCYRPMIEAFNPPDFHSFLQTMLPKKFLNTSHAPSSLFTLLFSFPFLGLRQTSFLASALGESLLPNLRLSANLRCRDMVERLERMFVKVTRGVTRAMGRGVECVRGSHREPNGGEYGRVGCAGAWGFGSGVETRERFVP